jgi:hypothetical protein
MTSQPTVDHRRIAIARDRLATWTRHRAMLGIEPGRLEALAGAIEAAGAALEGLERGAGEKAALRRRLGRAMEDVRLAVETLGRGLAHRAIARQEGALATVADDGPAQEGSTLRGRPAGGAAIQRPAILEARVLADGRVRLDMRCPGLGRDPTVRVLVRRRVGRRGSYEPIGLARGATYVDRSPRRAGRFAAYKIEVVAGPMAGATSRRALADFLIGNPTRGQAHTHLEPAGPATGWAGQNIASRAA